VFDLSSAAQAESRRRAATKRFHKEPWRRNICFNERTQRRDEPAL
jgi:hypothetical protein